MDTSLISSTFLSNFRHPSFKWLHGAVFLMDVPEFLLALMENLKK